MKYEIKLSAPNGDIVPLIVVACTKAHERATAGRTPFHEPTYNGSFQGFAAALLQEAKSGRLKVCDQWGSQSTADELIARAEAGGTLVQTSRFIKVPDWERLHRENEPIVPGAEVWDLTHLDLGPTVTDWAATYISALCTTLKWLNDWGATVGDEFALNHHGVEWVDERGILVGQAVPHHELDASLAEERKMDLRDAPPSDAPADGEPVPAPLTTEHMAFCFGGLNRWDDANWKKRLGNKPNWIGMPETPGQRGGDSATWNPVTVGAALVSKKKIKVNSVRAKFQTVHLLKPWADRWKTYEAEFLADE